MTASDESLCRHCLLPVGRRALEQTVNGETCAFCCYGCSIAFQVKNGKTEEWEAAWLLIRLGVGGFLSMNIMLFSLLIYGGVFTGADARLLPFIDILLLVLATPAVVILGGPFLRETLVEGALRPSDSFGADRTGCRRSVHLFNLGRHRRERAGLFRYCHHGADAVHAWPLSGGGRTGPGGARSRAAVGGRTRKRRRSGEWDGDRRPVREVVAGTLVRVRPGERIAVDGVIIEGSSHADGAVITGESRPVEKGVGSAVIAGSMTWRGLSLIRSRGREPPRAGTNWPVGARCADAAQPDSASGRPRGRRRSAGGRDSAA